MAVVGDGEPRRPEHKDPMDFRPILRMMMKMAMNLKKRAAMKMMMIPRVLHL